MRNLNIASQLTLTAGLTYLLNKGVFSAGVGTAAAVGVPFFPALVMATMAMIVFNTILEMTAPTYSLFSGWGNQPVVQPVVHHVVNQPAVQHVVHHNPAQRAVHPVVVHHHAAPQNPWNPTNVPNILVTPSSPRGINRQPPPINPNALHPDRYQHQPRPVARNLFPVEDQLSTRFNRLNQLNHLLDTPTQPRQLPNLNQNQNQKHVVQRTLVPATAANQTTIQQPVPGGGQTVVARTIVPVNPQIGSQGNPVNPQTAGQGNPVGQPRTAPAPGNGQHIVNRTIVPVPRPK